VTRRLNIGVVGLRFGADVHVPAFRNDARCEVSGIAGRDPATVADVARRLGVPRPFEDWRALVDAPDIDAVGIAVPPAAQPPIIVYAAEHGKHVFCEKPVAATVEDARSALAAVERSGVVHGIDFIFPEIAAWRRAQALLAAGAIGRIAHFAYTWRVETYASRTNADTWKSRPTEGGGALGNFVSHAFYNIEWLFGPIRRIPMFACPKGPRTGRAVDGIVDVEGVDGNVSGNLSVCTDAFLGSGHRIEIYGEGGTLTLHNPTPDYASGFHLTLGSRAMSAPAAMTDAETDSGPDGRLAPVSRLVRRFVDAIESGQQTTPNLSHGVRVQELLAGAAAVAERLSAIVPLAGPEP
jgi:predicted dehydrogenase